MTVPDGEPIDICATPDRPGSGLEYRGGVWLDDNTIVVGQANAGLLLVPATGGEPRVLVEKSEGDLGLKHPVLAGGRTILYLGQSQTRPEVRLVNVDAPADARVVVPSFNSPAYDSGTLYFLRQGALVGQACDQMGRLSGDVRRVALDTLSGQLNTGYGQVTAGGGHVAVMNTRPAARQCYWYARDGSSRRPFGDPVDQSMPSVSPDGRRIVISRRALGESNSSLWITDLEGSAARRLTTDYDDRYPIWSADGGRVMFRSTRGIAGNGNIFMVTAEGTPTITALATRFGSMYPAGWLPDGESFMWSTDSSVAPKAAGIYVSRPGVETDTLLRALAGVTDAILSPDGRYVAYSSAESGRREVYLDAVPRPLGRPIQLSQGGGIGPKWRADGRELCYLNGRTLMIVAITDGDPPRGGVPRSLFDTPVGVGRTSYAPAADGSRFIVLDDVLEAQHSVKVTLNWDAGAAR